MKTSLSAAVLILAMIACLIGETESRKFDEETRNKAIKNTRRVQ